MSYVYLLVCGAILLLVISGLVWYLLPFHLIFPPYLLTPLALGGCALLAWRFPPESRFDS